MSCLPRCAAKFQTSVLDLGKLRLRLLSCRGFKKISNDK